MNETAINETRANTRRNRRSTHRSVRERIVANGKLILETPASFGNGDADSFTDMPLLEDEVDRTPLLTGTSIAGALRNYLRERERGFEQESPRAPDRQSGQDEKQFRAAQKRERESLAVRLFGSYSGDDEGCQSPLIVHDARGSTNEYELRDGVKIDLATRTAADDKKYDYRLLAAGTTFELRFELLVGQPPDGDFAAHRRQLLRALVTALDGLTRGEITLGARKRRGFGRCTAEEWEVYSYDLTKPVELLTWLSEGREDATAWTPPVKPLSWTEFVDSLGNDAQLIADQRKQLKLSATFGVDGSVMVRSGFGESDKGADMVHLHSFRERQKQRRPIIAGTSWAGALRSRATQIINTMSAVNENKKGRELIESIFGPEVILEQRKNQTRRPARASRLVVAESVINEGRSLRQSRVKLDRFTGGASESALFDEEPLFGLPETEVKLDISLRTPGIAEATPSEHEQRQRRAEVGLLLLTLKDLWTGDLAIGGEVGIGRGRLAGCEATLRWNGEEWQLQHTDNGGLTVTGDKDTLEKCVTAFNDYLKHEVKHA